MQNMLTFLCIMMYYSSNLSTHKTPVKLHIFWSVCYDVVQCKLKRSTDLGGRIKVMKVFIEEIEEQ